jgi:hypothetical protein
MTMKIVQTARYLKDLKRLRATASDIGKLEQTIADNPTAGSVIPGLNGIRKLRFSLGSKGKRGGGRAIYFLMVSDDLVAMLFAYAKSEKEDMTPAEKKAAIALMKEIVDDQS